MDENRPHLERVPDPPAAAQPGPASDRGPWRLSAIWLLPVVAVLVVAALGVHTWQQRGPTVRIRFATADGLAVQTTAVKYRSVEIGRVTDLELAPDRTGVVVVARLSSAAEDLVGEGTRFWVVRPRVSPAGLTGLDTVINGPHITLDPGPDAAAHRRVPGDFQGLEAPPADVAGRRGRRYALRAENVGSLGVGSPVYLRRFQVGEVTGARLDGDQRVRLAIFVEAPHDRQITADTRFWNASGVDVALDAQGIRLDTQSLTSVLQGGIALQTPGGAAGASPAAEGTSFDLHPDRAAALRPTGERTHYRMVFQRAVRGVQAGTPVDLLGLDLGEVTGVSVDFDPHTAAPRTRLDLALHLDRLLLEGGIAATPAEARALLERLVRRGLRGRVRTDNLITGQRRVVFDLVPGAAPVAIDRRAPVPTLPALEGGSEDLPEAMGRLVARLEAVPLDELAREGTEAVRQMRRTFEGLDRSLSPQAPVQQELRRTMRDLGAAGYALKSLAEYLERHPESLVRGKQKDRP